MAVSNSDRSWPLPSRNHAMRMSWHDLLFLHWPIGIDDLTRLLGPHMANGLEVDTFEGQAWIGLVPFRMSDVAPRGIPAIPWMSAFPELNIRTYVTIDNKPGVWFFSLDATNPIAVRVARFAFHLPYMDARMHCREIEGWIDYSSKRTHRGEEAANFVGKYRPVGDPFLSEPGSLEHWLTARYCLYTADKKGRLLRGEIHHPPWELASAECEISECTMFDWLNVWVDDTHPHLLFSKEIHVQAWTNDRL